MTEPNLDEQIEDIIMFIGDRGWHDNRGAKADCSRCRIADKAKPMIKTLIAQQVKEAKIDELERLLRPFLNKRVYGVNAVLTINAHNRIITLKGDNK